MKPSKWAVLLLAVATGMLMTSSAFARGRVFLGFNFGFPGYYYPAPYYYPAYYPYPYYPPVVVQQSPPVYTERQDVAPANEQGYWYYCAATRGYYPYVKNCSRTWMQVVPQANPGTPRLATDQQVLFDR
jgi:hypothetical protein